MRKHYFIAIMLVAISCLKAATTQTITFPSLSVKGYGDVTFSLSATASSGLAVNYTSSDLTVATISGSTVTIKKAGYCIISAFQAGNVSYAAATTVTQPLVVCAKGTLTVKATDLSALYAAAVPTPTNTITGFKTGETASVITGSPLYNPISSNLSNGTYPIVINRGTMAATNYDFEMVDGIFTVSGGPTLDQSYTANDLNLKIYPNPSTDYLFVENAMGATITVLNILGDEVIKQKSNDQLLKLNVSVLRTGLYIVNVNKGGEVQCHKIKIINN